MCAQFSCLLATLGAVGYGRDLLTLIRLLVEDCRAFPLALLTACVASSSQIDTAPSPRSHFIKRLAADGTAAPVTDLVGSRPTPRQRRLDPWSLLCHQQRAA
jgi:hypothetical protein